MQVNQVQSMCKKIDKYIFRFADVLGQGNFSKVYRGTHEITNENVAIKVVELNSLKSTKLEQLLFSEIDILKKLNHPNILKCHEVFTSNRNCYIVTEVCNGGDLETKLRKQHHFTEAQAESYILDVFKGLKYLAENNVIHRDIKVANIFLHNGMAKIADFGFAKFTTVNFQDVNIGSPIYMSPQGLLNNTYGPKTDVWAFGMLLYELLHGKTPYLNCRSESDLRKQIKIPISFSSMRSDLSYDLRQVITLCLEINQQKRVSISELEKTAYFRNICKIDRVVLGQRQMNIMSSQPTNRLKTHYSQQKPQHQARSFHSTSNQNSLSRAVELKKPQSVKIPNKSNTTVLSTKNEGIKTRGLMMSPTYSTQTRSFSTEKGYINFKAQQNRQSKPKDYSRHAHGVAVTAAGRKNQETILPGIINFKETVNILHYCRLLYKYLMLLRESDPNSSTKSITRVISAWIFKILAEIEVKIEKKQIVYEEEGPKKEIKLREVTSEYQRKYSSKIEKSYLNQATFDLVISEVSQAIHECDGAIAHRSSNFENSIPMGHFLLMILDATRLLKKCAQQLRFWDWNEYKLIEQFLGKNKNHLHFQGYLDLKRNLR